MGIVRPYALILSIGIAVFGLTITPAKAAQFTIDPNGGLITVQEKPVEAGQTDPGGGGDATKSHPIDGGQRDDYNWGAYDLLDQPLGNGFRLDNGDESSFRIQKIRTDGY